MHSANARRDGSHSGKHRHCGLDAIDHAVASRTHANCRHEVMAPDLEHVYYIFSFARVFTHVLKMSRRLCMLLSLLAMLAAAPAGVHADALDFDLPGGHFYKQANGQGGHGQTGY